MQTFYHKNFVLSRGFPNFFIGFLHKIPPRFFFFLYLLPVFPAFSTVFCKFLAFFLLFYSFMQENLPPPLFVPFSTSYAHAFPLFHHILCFLRAEALYLPHRSARLFALRARISGIFPAPPHRFLFLFLHFRQNDEPFPLFRKNLLLFPCILTGTPKFSFFPPQNPIIPPLQTALFPPFCAPFALFLFKKKLSENHPSVACGDSSPARGALLPIIRCRNPTIAVMYLFASPCSALSDAFDPKSFGTHLKSPPTGDRVQGDADWTIRSRMLSNLRFAQMYILREGKGLATGTALLGQFLFTTASPS